MRIVEKSFCCLTETKFLFKLLVEPLLIWTLRTSLLEYSIIYYPAPGLKDGAIITKVSVINKKSNSISLRK